MSKLQKDRPRLGRGLSSLISVSDLPIEREIPIGDRVSSGEAVSRASLSDSKSPEESVPTSTTLSGDDKFREVAIAAILVNPHQPRRQMDEQALNELAASLKSTGLIQPIIVRRQGDRFELIAGERRWRAAQLAGFTTIPVIITDVDSFSQAQMALVENTQRENLNPIDRALAYKTLIGQLGLTQAELAVRLGEDRSSIANYLRLLDLSESLQEMTSDGRLSMGHAKLLAGVSDILEQSRLANLVITQDLSVRNLERLIKEGGKPTPSTIDSAPSPSAHLQDLEKNLSRQLGMRVQVRGSARSKAKGRLILHYANLDQFDDLVGRLGLKTE